MNTTMKSITTTVAAIILGAAVAIPQQASARPMIWLPHMGGHPLGSFGMHPGGAFAHPMGVPHPGMMAGMHPGGNWHGSYWHGYNHGYGYGYFGAGLLAGALLSAPFYGYGYGYPYGYGGYDYYGGGYGDADAYCAAHFRTYDPATHTYIGYDGLLHHCP